MPEDWTLIPRLAQVHVPVLFLLADPAYTIIPPALEAELRAVAPSEQVQIQVIPGTTHNMLRGPGYRPTYQTIRQFLG
jgi:pimeloyl-ACP methyl ester carboxylesterase